MTKIFKIGLLGEFRHSGAEALSLPRKARGLLAYLAMNPGRAVSRDQLADLLWSDSEPEQGRHSLRQALTMVRRSVKGHARCPISAGVGHVTLEAEATETDVTAFERLAQSTTLADLRAAAELYRGEFLSDLDIASEPFAEWIDAERSRFGALASAMLRRLALASYRAGDVEAAILTAQRLIARDQLNEDGHRLLMQLYARAGRRGEALRQFAACVDHLKRELDVTPDETTITLAEAIRAGGSSGSPALVVADEELVADIDAPALVGDIELTERPVARDKRATAPQGAVSGTKQAAAFPPPTQNRQLTVMATELVGLLSLAARSDAEDITEVTTDCYRRCAELIERHDGSIARLAGDGIIAYFGYPQAHELDPENAVRAALELKTLAAELSAEFDLSLQPCTGIATGVVVIEGRQREGSALGEAVTRSGRMQALARPGQILIGGCTQRLLGRLFEYQDLGLAEFKGLPVPFAIAEVTGASENENRFEAQHALTLTPMVGRKEEINGLLRRWRQARRGEGTAVLLVGEPGIGKSRVVQAVSERLGDEKAFMRLFCSPYHGDSPLHPFVSAVEREADLRSNDSAEQRLAKLDAMVCETSHNGDDITLHLAQLLSIPTGERCVAPSLTPQQRKDRTFKALVAWIENSTASRPLVLTIEDLHWADPTTLELIDMIVERAPRRPLLVLLTARPEFQPPWSGRIQTSLTTLGRLSPRQCEAMVSSLCQDRQLPVTVTDDILNRADGIPLFVEELTKAVLERETFLDGGGRHHPNDQAVCAEIPTTLHASLLARLDRLDGTRDVVQLGAALGRQFSHRLIRAAAEMPQQELEGALEQLVDAGLIWRRGCPPDADYTFKHALVQDAAYGTLRQKRRRTLHARIAEAYEGHFPEVGETQPELIAHHCTEAGLAEKAAYLWGKAGEASLSRSALKEAATQFTRALALIDTLPATPGLRREQIKFQIALANALMHTKGYAAPETKAALDRARMLVQRAETLGEPPEDPVLFLSVLHGFWVASHVGFEGNAVRDLSVELMALASKQGTPFSLVLAHRVMGTSLLYLGDIAGGRDHLDKALALYDPLQHRAMATRFGQEAGVAILSNRPLALWLLGHPVAAQRDTEDAMEQARALGQTASFLYALTRIAWVHLVMGNYEVAEVQTQQLMAVAEDMEGSYWKAAGTMLQGCLLARTGQGALAIDLITSGIAASRLSGANLLRMPWYLSCLANAQVAVGQIDEARRCMNEALTAMATSQESWQESDLYRMQGDLARMASDTKAAEKCYKRAIAVAQKQHAKLWELRAATALARLWHDQGRPQRGLDLLAPVRGWFTEGFDTSDLKQADALLAELGSTGARP